MFFDDNRSSDIFMIFSLTQQQDNHNTNNSQKERFLHSMDFDEKSPLNLAHRIERQAEDHIKAERFDSAVLCLQTASGHLQESLSLTHNPKALEAIQCQILRNQQQIEVVRKKKQQLIQSMEGKIKKQEVLDHQSQQHQLKGLGNKLKGINLKEESKGIETRIIQAMEEHDSLLQVLLEKHNPSRPEKSPGKESVASPPSSSSSSSSLSASIKSGSKVAKGDKTIIEELKTSNEHLRLLVMQLVSQLELLQQENQLLSKKISILESESTNNDTCSLPQLPPLETPQLFY